MREKIKKKATQIAQNPKVKEAFFSMKPQKSFWGIMGVIGFFILPEIIAYIWGADITTFAKEQLFLSHLAVEKQCYELLIFIFEDGISWFNLGIGGVLLVWLFF